MEQIIVKQLSRDELEQLGVFEWPVWEKEVSEFDWSYSSSESCYILAGQATVTPEGGEPVTFGVGDFVVFPDGMDCTWSISEAIRKHYNFA
jgi:uncharacterized protein